MKVKFFLYGLPNIGMRKTREEREKRIDLIESILDKVNTVTVDLPCVPTKNMGIDLLSFADSFGFNEIEYDLIKSFVYCKIDRIYINPTYLEVWIEPC